jgi:MscS family membrane protein
VSFWFEFERRGRYGDDVTASLLVRWRRHVAALGLLSAFGILLGAPGLAAAPTDPPPTPTVTPVPETSAASDSPRASVLSFLELARKGRWDEAARYLELPAADAARGPELARRLKAVLDAHVWLDPDEISPLPGGRQDDGLPPDVDELTTLPGAGGGRQPVRLVKRPEPEGGRWLFTRATVSRIDNQYAALKGRWALENLPAPLLKPGPGELLWWQWLALPLILLVSWGAGILLGRLTTALFGRLAARTETTLDDEILARLGRPLALAWALIVLSIPLAALELYAPAERLVGSVRRAGLLAVVFWAALRTVDVARAALLGSAWARERPSSRALVPLAARIGKVLLLALAVVAALSTLGYPVTGLLAGLGIGGIAVALAAQKTVENLFGSFSIGVDQPFREGDLVKIDNVFGFVERIGLRSSRIRTLDRTLVSIPNGGLAEQRIESFAVRDRLRLAADIGLTYDTTAEQMRNILTKIEAALRSHPKIWPDAVTVAFQGFGDSSLNVLVMAWFLTTDWGEFLRIRQEMLLQFMEIVESEGSSFAFPTRTVHLVPSAGASP